MLLRRRCTSAGVLGKDSIVHQQVPRQCCCRAKRGRPRKTDEADTAQFDEFQQPVEAGRETPKRKGRPRKTDAQADEPLATTQGLQEPSHHDRLISLEGDITTSMELDYTDDAGMEGVFAYSHQAQGHDSNDLPPLEFGQQTDIYSPGFVDETADIQQQELEIEGQQQALEDLQSAAEAAAAAAGRAALAKEAARYGAPQGGARGFGVRPLAPAATDAAMTEEEMLLEKDEPPGVFDYEAGLKMARTIIEPEQQMTHMPPEWRPRSRAEADYRIQWTNWVSTLERQRVQKEYELNAFKFQSNQVKESENIYLTAKAMAIVTAEIELEDHETGNRWDSFYPVWARAEHRWYPTGRFHAYNQYVKENIDNLTMKYAPGADQEEEFDLLEDVFLMADDPNIPGGESGDAVAESGPASGLNLDNFISGMLPGTASSELGQSYLEDVLAPNEEELEEELE